MKLGLFYFIAVSVAFVAACSTADAQSRADQCSAWARQMASSSLGTTGPLRGAARGAIGGAIAGNAGRAQVLARPSAQALAPCDARVSAIRRINGLQ